MITTLRRIVLFLWVTLILFLGFSIYQHRDFLDPQKLLLFFQSFGTWALFVYIGASLIRGLVLLPSLPLVLVGLLFFPNNPHLVFIISMLGIIFSGILIYGFSDIMGFDEMFAKNMNNTKIKTAIEKYGFYAVTVWSFLPVVPTDLICYVAGTVRMNFWKFICGLCIGESIIVATIIYGGQEMMKWLGL